MKNSLRFAVFTLAVLSFSVPSFALDFLLGAKAGYFVWRPYFQEMSGSGIDEIETGRGVLYGPAFSVIINEDISFSMVALFGTQSTYWDNDATVKIFGPEEIVSTGTFYSEIQRVDVDSALSYRLSGLFKVFIGYKYQYTETTMRGTFLMTNAAGEEYVRVGDVLLEIPAHGPAIGVGFSHTIGASFFVSCNLSAMYLFSKHNFERDEWLQYRATGAGQIEYQTVLEGSGNSFETRQVGFNIEPSFGLAVGDVIATLGIRFQWVRMQFIDDPVMNNHQFAPDGWMNDYLYGVFIGAMYRL